MVYTYCISSFPLKMLFREANSNIGTYLINTLRSYAQLDDTHTHTHIYWRHIYLIFFSCYLKVVPICLALINIYGLNCMYYIRIGCKTKTYLLAMGMGSIKGKGHFVYLLLGFLGHQYLLLFTLRSSKLSTFRASD